MQIQCAVTNASVLQMMKTCLIFALRLLAKVLVGGGAVYITLDQGVWSTSSKGSNAVERIRTNVLPATNDYLNKVSSFCSLNCSLAKFTMSKFLEAKGW